MVTFFYFHTFAENKGYDCARVNIQQIITETEFLFKVHLLNYLSKT